MPEVGVSEEGVCCTDHLPVKFNDPKLINEIFMRIDMKHSYICLQSFFSVVETFVVCQKFLLYKEI